MLAAACKFATRSNEHVVMQREHVMSDTFGMSVRQAAEFDHACERNGVTPADVKVLSSGSMLARILPVLRGCAEITVVTHIIDCDADPAIPYNGWTVEQHVKRGKVQWDPSQYRLHLQPSQQKGSSVQGYKLREELADLPTANANLLDYLLEHPQLIPEEWKKDENGNIRYIFFWSTVYRNSVGRLCVRYLCFSGGRWQAYYDYLGSQFGGELLSLVRAS
ncbi:MAG: hypothetical protein A3E36_04035 [Candidatus Andersenbacteria bacterium RIFCSPHIGHO2_12_FULL_45_11b]|uniref:Uncharacterized protein n=1 Tax=Candidatus Andersenbacteria bacterium RIFCSPHIGHO2_12_FULL_45_11b TaxID=1797282 RepID=A0A1G1XA10_9BACT|nr:MAG: hypothetical protein A3E36_04035 [Candidatus Andersenbacteria bacterium RIFCSPHIGHO2_12_FULL_45_11b]